MKRIGGNEGTYARLLKDRGIQSKVFHSHQFLGLEIASILHDLEHKSLYIKLAKGRDPQQLLSLAKSVAEKRDVRNRGAYFMKLLSNLKA